MAQKRHREKDGGWGWGVGAVEERSECEYGIRFNDGLITTQKSWRVGVGVGEGCVCVGGGGGGGGQIRPWKWEKGASSCKHPTRCIRKPEYQEKKPIRWREKKKKKKKKKKIPSTYPFNLMFCCCCYYYWHSPTSALRARIEPRVTASGRRVSDYATFAPWLATRSLRLKEKQTANNDVNAASACWLLAISYHAHPKTAIAQTKGR